MELGSGNCTVQMVIALRLTCGLPQLGLCRRATFHPFITRFMSAAGKKRPFSVMASANNDLLDESDFNKIGEELRAYDEQREQVIKRSRDIGKLSKQAIYSLHRGAINDADAKLANAAKAARELLPLISASPTLRSGSFAGAIEEYAEAVVFKEYLASGKLATQAQVELAEIEEYLGGVLDFTGELNRYAVARATVRDKEAVQRSRDLVDSIMGQFLQFDLRNGNLRRKYDSLKYTLKKLENTLYELSLGEAGLGRKSEEVPELEGGQALASRDEDA